MLNELFLPLPHFSLQFENPKWFSNRKLSEYSDILKHNAKMMLSGRDKKGRRVYLSRMSEFRFESFHRDESSWQLFFRLSAQAANLSLMDLAQLDDLWMESMLDEVETIENGIVVLLDMSG
jgi:CRAL/TRIO domain